MIAETGVTLLMFTLGVEFSFHTFKHIFSSVIESAIVQMLLSFCIFFGIFSFFFPMMTALFLGIAASLSSTAVIVKVLTESTEMETVHGELLTGWALIQDLAVVPIMLILPIVIRAQSVGSGDVFSTISSVVFTVFTSILTITIVVFLAYIGVPKLLNVVAKMANRELFLIATVGFVFTAGMLSYGFGLSAALGAFIAGLLVAETSQNHTIFAELRPLRDLFSVVFFVSIGMMLSVTEVLPYSIPLVISVCAVISIKFFLVYILTRIKGFHQKTSFLVGLGLTQMSEFGFIIAQMGKSMGVLSESSYVFLVSLAFLTILISTPLFASGHALYAWYKSFVRSYFPHLFLSKKEFSPLGEGLAIHDHVVICGYGRMGKYIGRALHLSHIPFVVVDYNHTTVRMLRDDGIPVVYGDPSDREVLESAQIVSAHTIIIAIPDRHTQEMIIHHARDLHPTIRLMCRSHYEGDQKHLKTLGVSIVIQPEFEAALSVIVRLLGESNLSEKEIAGKISRIKLEHGTVES